MPDARWWKEFYAAERSSLGQRGMEAFFQTPLSSRRRGTGGVVLPPRGAIIFPHTRLTASGYLVAAAARAIIDSERENILALGVLHLGEQRNDETLRGIHGPGAPGDKGIWRNEFSLDNFEAMLAIAARLAGKRTPKLIARYPFLTGEQPESRRGFGELLAFVQRGAAIVATADMVHHGAGYGTPGESRLARESDSATEFSKRAIDGQLTSLAHRNFSTFHDRCDSAHSDFRDAGPVLTALLPMEPKFVVTDITLVNYSDVLNAQEPTWVAAALALFR